MWFLLPGIGAFVLFFLYDWHTVTGRVSWLRGGFFAGCLLLAVSLAGLLATALAATGAGPVRLTAGLIAAGGFLLLLLYTLFGAIPFDATYLQEGGRPCVCRRGVYALCRHPGVLWLFGFTLCLWLALGTRPLLAAWLLFSASNLLYVWLQDRWSFPRTFADYDDYRREVPFLLPRPRSLRRCLNTLRKGDDEPHEV